MRADQGPPPLVSGSELLRARRRARDSPWERVCGSDDKGFLPEALLSILERCLLVERALMNIDEAQRGCALDGRTQAEPVTMPAVRCGCRAFPNFDCSTAPV